MLQVFAAPGAGFDIVSGGELMRVLPPAAIRARWCSPAWARARRRWNWRSHEVLSFNVESIPELDRLNAVAGRLGKRARVSLRINPDVDAVTHPYISTGLKGNKFGIAFEDVLPTYRAAALPHLEVVGIDCHIGSQITEVAPYRRHWTRCWTWWEALAQEGIDGAHRCRRRPRVSPTPTKRRRTSRPSPRRCCRTAARGHGHREVLFEPGRSPVGNAGLLLARVEYLKPGATKNFCIVDAAMNDLARPAMYEAYHAIEAVALRAAQAVTYDVVGPVCESGDWLGRDRARQFNRATCWPSCRLAPTASS